MLPLATTRKSKILLKYVNQLYFGNITIKNKTFITTLLIITNFKSINP